MYYHCDYDYFYVNELFFVLSSLVYIWLYCIATNIHCLTLSINLKVDYVSRLPRHPRLLISQKNCALGVVSVLRSVKSVVTVIFLLLYSSCFLKAFFGL